MENIAVLGAGNAGRAMAAHLAHLGFGIRLYNRSEKGISALRRNGGIYLKGCLGERFVKIPVITTDMKEAVEGADLVAVVVPTTAHGFMAEALAPHVHEGTVVLLNPGHTAGAINFASTLERSGAKHAVTVCETNTNVYISRITDEDDVTVYNLAGQVLFSCLPGKRLSAMADLIGRIAPNIKPVPTVLDTGFSNLNAIMHPAGMIMNTGWVEQGEQFYFYAEGGTQGVTRVMDAVDCERMAIMRALGLEAVPFPRLFYEYGATSKEAAVSGDMHRALLDSAPNRLIKAPDTMTHRFLDEDIRCGLVPMESFAKLVGVKTPAISALIDLACIVNQIDYRLEGLSLQNLGLEGKGTGDLQEYLIEG